MTQNPYEPQNSAPVAYQSAPLDPTKRPAWMGIVALVCGILGLFAWCLPICGCPVNIAGIVFGILGLKSDSRGMAIAGLIMSGVGMLATLINGAVGVYMAMTGKGVWAP